MSQPGSLEGKSLATVDCASWQVSGTPRGRTCQLVVNRSELRAVKRQRLRDNNVMARVGIQTFAVVNIALFVLKVVAAAKAKIQVRCTHALSTTPLSVRVSVYCISVCLLQGLIERKRTNRRRRHSHHLCLSVWCVCVCVSVCLSVCLSLSLSLSLSICLSVCLCVCVCVCYMCLSVCLCVCLCLCLCVYLCVCLCVCMYVCPLVCLSVICVCVSVCLPACLCVCVPVSVCLPMCLPVRLCLCLCLCLCLSGYPCPSVCLSFYSYST